jgi:hypothetical protein
MKTGKRQPPDAGAPDEPKISAPAYSLMGMTT